jgi:hypothetical protein
MSDSIPVNPGEIFDNTVCAIAEDNALEPNPSPVSIVAQSEP